MRIITTACPSCGTIVAGNVLESERLVKCPGLDCDEIHAFEDLPADERAAVLERIEDAGN